MHTFLKPDQIISGCYQYQNSLLEMSFSIPDGIMGWCHIALSGFISDATNPGGKHAPGALKPPTFNPQDQTNVNEK